MTGEATLKEVLARLGRAMDALENSVSARLEHEQDYSEAEAEVQRMNADRARLAQELDNSEARSERLAQALTMVIGTEAFIALNDVAGLDRQQAHDVRRWAIDALVAAALNEAYSAG